MRRAARPPALPWTLVTAALAGLALASAALARPDSRAVAARPDESPSQAASRPVLVPPMPPLAPGDILRLKLGEYPIDGPPPSATVQFRSAPGQPAVEELARRALAQSGALDDATAQMLEKGRANQKLQVVLRATGLAHADRIEIRGDTPPFAVFRRRVLPLVLQGCVRSGCHAGREAPAFNVPLESRGTDRFVYSTFVLLDRMQTPAGPMIDRGAPEDSALLRYLLPPENGLHPHPPVPGQRLLPVLTARGDRGFNDISEWIATLKYPRPEYGLRYAAPAWLEALWNGEAASVASAPASQPASAPESSPALAPCEP